MNKLTKKELKEDAQVSIGRIIAIAKQSNNERLKLLARKVGDDIYKLDIKK